MTGDQVMNQYTQRGQSCTHVLAAAAAVRPETRSVRVPVVVELSGIGDLFSAGVWRPGVIDLIEPSFRRTRTRKKAKLALVSLGLGSLPCASSLAGEKLEWACAVVRCQLLAHPDALCPAHPDAQAIL